MPKTQEQLRAEQKGKDDKRAAEKAAAEKRDRENEESVKKNAAGKKVGTIRIFARNLICPEQECGFTEYNFTVRENLVDVSQPMTCRNCQKEIKPAIVEAATDPLTDDEVGRLLPKA